MADVYHLSFSIGPVQGFVAQARRTRDLWAGSWLLSYLAESALVAAEAEGLGGEAIIPYRAESDRRQVTSKQTAVGGIPNRFEMRFSGDDAADRAQAAANAADTAFRAAWQQVADAVWDAFVESVTDKGNGTQGIWDRQIKKFWELSWVIGQPETQQSTIGHLAAMRKHFRNSVAAEERGIKCSLMPTLQEISGSVGRGSEAFWKALRQQEGVRGLNLGDSERFCAIALIKRLFPQVIQQAVGDEISPELNQVGWPSTAFMAAVPWLKSLSGDAQTASKEYQKQALAAGYQRSERQAARDADIDWAEADGPIWFTSAIRNDEPGRDQLGPTPTDDQKRERKSAVDKLLNTLQGVYRAAAGANDGEQKTPVPYYSLLLMDGDSMGELLGQLGNPQALSECLGTFASQVDGIVKTNDGRTVYAGGDDVLALVPATQALQTAEQLCDQYREAFSNTDAAKTATISAAIVYAHWRYPLRQVLRTAHRLLDKVAKDQTGRDSVAIGIVQGSGLNAVWSVPWSVLRGQVEEATSLVKLVEEHFGSDVQDEQAKFNASYLYLLRERFGRLFDDSKDQPGEFRRIPFAPDLLRDLAHAEYRRRLTRQQRREISQQETQPMIDQLMSLSREWKRNKPEAPESDPLTFAFDGWRVARFLRQLQDGKVGADD